MAISSINIRPGVSILSVLSHLNYRPWYAIAEFVDNSVQSFFDYRRQLERVEGSSFVLKVAIETDSLDGGRIVIRDNAAGIHAADYERAFRPAALPPQRGGLSEFGMGMKSAACWFARNWSVRTTALGEPVERELAFDISKIVQDELEELEIKERPIQADVHFTEICLRNLHRALQGRTTGKIKEHLASIYRVFIRQGLLLLTFDGEILDYPEPTILNAPHFRQDGGQPTTWRKEIDLQFGSGLKVTGFAALRETANTSKAGFALFRRGRLIQGSADDAYRPEYVFGKPNSFTYQRLFGELHLEGFEVSHTKDGFRFEEHEETFLRLLKAQLNENPIPLLEQANGYRVRPKQQDIQKGAEEAVRQTADVVEEYIPPVLAPQLKAEPERTAPPASLPDVDSSTRRTISVELDEIQWQIQLELVNDPAVTDWLTVSYRNETDKDAPAGSIGIRVSMAHPFMTRFSGTDAEQIEPILRIAVAIGLAEAAARASGLKSPGTIRNNINELLRDALSKP